MTESGYCSYSPAHRAMVSLFNPNLRMAATAGGFYMGAAGIYHIIRYDRRTGREEVVAMASDLWILIVVLVYCFYGKW